MGSWVKLSNKEIGKVVGGNPGHPLRPKVNIMFYDLGNALDEPQLVDLVNNVSLQVLQPLSDEELKEEIKKK